MTSVVCEYPLAAGNPGAVIMAAVIARCGSFSTTPGEVFTSPVPDQVTAATRAVDAGRGVVHIVKNYTGDVLNFKLAGELGLGDLEEAAVKAELAGEGGALGVKRQQLVSGDASGCHSTNLSTRSSPRPDRRTPSLGLAREEVVLPSAARESQARREPSDTLGEVAAFGRPRRDTLHDEDLMGRPDDAILEAAGNHERVLVTLDRSIGQTALRTPGHRGVVVLRPLTQSAADVVTVATLSSLPTPPELRGSVVVVDSSRVRIRRRSSST